jgi:hypothetical protein
MEPALPLSIARSASTSERCSRVPSQPTCQSSCRPKSSWSSGFRYNTAMASISIRNSGAVDFRHRSPPVDARALYIVSADRSAEKRRPPDDGMPETEVRETRRPAGRVDTLVDRANRARVHVPPNYEFVRCVFATMPILLFRFGCPGSGPYCTTAACPHDSAEPAASSDA